MNRFSYIGRPDGLGNRFEEIIKLEAICSKMNIECDYIWTNRGINRSYNVCFFAEKVKITENSEPVYDVRRLSDFIIPYNQKDLLTSAQKILPNFIIRFRRNIQPTGVHIRGTDRIGKTHPHFMKNEQEIFEYLSGAIDLIKKSKPKYLFVCSEDQRYKDAFLKCLDNDIEIVEPLHNPEISSDYVDLFSLALCKEVYMASKFSSFPITASLIGNIPLVSFVYDEDVKIRYMALFRYHLNYDKGIVRQSFLNRCFIHNIKEKIGRILSICPLVVKKKLFLKAGKRSRS